MSDLTIKVESLSKSYRITHQNQGSRYKTLREELIDLPKRLLSRFSPPSAAQHPQSEEDFWALRDVSFEVKQGEVVGIIGRNGAGKSTLLKILSRISEPTKGRIDVFGRIASLLEVGTGFHPELTGRENIYLNGAIMGMSRAEIKARFDEIVAFAEVERFLDTPVKRYSSGMYVRLAFAVAAHLEPDILIVDEVLAVGDAAFQKKCLDKMQDVSQHGRTVLFVSHNMPAVTRLCSRTLLLEAGKMVKDGTSHEVISAYMGSGSGAHLSREWIEARRPGDDLARLCSVRIVSETNNASGNIDIRQQIGIEMEFEILQPGPPTAPNFHLYNDEGILIFIAIDQDPIWKGRSREPGRYFSSAWIPGNLLAEATIFVGVALSSFQPVTIHFFERDAVAFTVVDLGRQDSARGDYLGPLPGVVRPLLHWTTKFTPSLVPKGEPSVLA